MRMNPEEIEKRTPEILGRMYLKTIYTRNLAELLLQEEAKTFPVCILRATIVGAALNEPFPGWIDTIAGVAIIYLSTGLGLNRIAVGKLHKISDQIPVDLVVNTIICAAALYCKENSPLIVHVGSSSRNPVTWGLCKNVVTATWIKFPPEKAVSRPNVQLTGSMPAYNTYAATKTIPLYFQKALGKMIGNREMVKVALRTEKAMKRDTLLIKALAPFALTEWIFSTQNVQEMIKMMTAEEICRFEIDPAAIDWKIYLANFICGIKKYVLQEPIASSFNAESLDVNWDITDSKRFADIKWALSKGASINSREVSEMKSLIINSPRVQKKIQELAKSESNKSLQEANKEFNNQAKEYLNLILADIKMPVVRVMGWILKKVWRSIYDRIIIDQNSLTRLSKYIKNSKGPVIIVPSHKSYVDFLIISFIFFAYRIKVPYIASSDKFLTMAVIRKLLRASGGFFFLRQKETKGDLFKTVVAEYVTQLLKDNQLVEFYIEGIRSRSGKIQNPKFEMLSICANAYFEGEVPEISFVPISISYDRVIESDTFPLELLGESTEQESLMRLVKGVQILNQSFGRIHISICEPLLLSEFSKSCGPDHSETIVKLGYEVVFRLQESSLIMPTSIVAAILLMSRRMIGEDELITKVEWARDEILARGHKVSGIDKGGVQYSVKNAVSLLSKYIINRKDLFNPRVSMSNNKKNIFLLAYYSNALHHVFVLEALIACTLYSFGETVAWEEGVPLARVIEETALLTSLLKYEFVTRGDITDPRAITEVLSLWKKRGVLEEAGDKVKINKNSGMTVIFLCSLVWPVIDTYWSTLVFCSALRRKQSISFEKLLQSVQWFAENMCAERTLSFYESCSMYNIRHALHCYEKMEILVVTNKGVREVELNEKYIDNDLLEEMLDHIAKFRKISMVRKVGAHHELRRALLAEFPKL